ncbi:Hsp33 family molecular chaperone HslO [soil metagenome]
MTGDHALRAITEDGAFRVVCIETTDTARAIVAAQKAQGSRAKLLAEMATGAVLVRQTMAPDLRVQAILQGQDPKTRIVTDAFPDGSARGLVQAQPGAEVELGDRAVLQMMRTLHNGEIQQGFVQADSGSGLSGALMEYMQASEQVVSFIAVSAVMEGEDHVASAGGYIVQLLPEVGDGPLMIMTERLKDFPPLDDLLKRGHASPRELMSELLYAMPFAEVGSEQVRFACICSDDRLMTSLASLPKSDIRELLEGGEVLEIDCDYCGRHYRFAPEKLRGLLETN